MTYSKGHRMISIEINDLLGGKRPGLYIGEGFKLLKVASFSSFEKAQIFDEWLRYFFGEMLITQNEEEVNKNGMC